MNQETKTIIETLQNRMSVLMSMFSILKSKNEELTKDKEILKQKIEQQQNSISELEKKLNTLQIAKDVSDPSSRNDNSARKYIEGIVREIDSCIVLLNK